MSLPQTTVSNPPFQAMPLDANKYFSQPWVHFFQFLYGRVGGSSAPSNTALEDAIAGGQGGATVPITVGASPFTYQSLQVGSVLISGGGLENVEFSRDGINFFSTGNFRGFLPLSANDQLRVTYMAPPTMTFVPR